MPQPAPDAPEERPSKNRLVTLDLIRGVAVLGVLAINIAGFAGPTAATLSPHMPEAGTLADEWAFAAAFVLFEGKMRTLFSLLFGASLLLFIDRANASGHFGELLQIRRLAWLLLFGLAHYFLFWWGDILFLYAVAGFLALLLHDMEPRKLGITALAMFASWHAAGALQTLPDALLEERVRIGTAAPEEAREYALVREQWLDEARHEVGEAQEGFGRQIATKVSESPLYPLETTFYSIGETLSLMLLGMALYRTGFFAGDWPRRRVWQIAGWSTATGLALTLAILGWVWPRHFPIQAMYSAVAYWTAVPHLLMALGYAALLVLAAPALARTGPGRQLIAAGRMAFSNYLLTTVVMTAIFYGWGLGLIGTVPTAALPLFVLLGWTLMLAWSAPWLARFRHGPLEWLWRCLTWRKIFPLRCP